MTQRFLNLSEPILIHSGWRRRIPIHASGKQGWEFAHSLMDHSLIAHSLICSFRSNQMSDCELFAQIAQDKYATVSESLRSHKTNERPWANRSGRSWKMSDHERFAQVAHDKFWFYLGFFIKKNERFEQIAQVPHQKWAMWANRTGRSPKMSESLLFLSKSLMRSFFSQKTSDLLRKPMIKFPALQGRIVLSNSINPPQPFKLTYSIYYISNHPNLSYLTHFYNHMFIVHRGSNLF